MLLLLPLWMAVCTALQPVLDWDSLFDSLSILVDDVYSGEYSCVGNNTGHMNFLVFDAPLFNPTDLDIQPAVLPYFNVSLYNSSGLLATSYFQLAYLRDEFCPSIQPGFDNVFYGGLSAGCNVTVKKEVSCSWLDISQLINNTGPLELRVLYDGEERNYTFELDGLAQHYPDGEFSWLAFSLLLAPALVLVVTPSTSN